MQVFVRAAMEELGTAFTQALIDIAFVAYRAFEMLHAILLTLVRLVITQRRLLEWETAASGAARSAGLIGKTGIRLFFVEMASSPATALVLLLLLWAFRPEVLTLAAPFLTLWAAAPLIAWWLSRPVMPERLVLGPTERALFGRAARNSWRYFESFLADEDHGLPPDNFQELPGPLVAHRTSPTNIGLGLLSVLAARDLGIIETGELVERVDRMLSTMEGLERHEGHLLNWYDTRSLAPLAPRYVSTVDSGNLAGALIALAHGLNELARDPQNAERGAPLEGLARRALAFVEGMSFGLNFITVASCKRRQAYKGI